MRRGDLPTTLTLPHLGRVDQLVPVGEGAAAIVLRGRAHGADVGVKIARGTDAGAIERWTREAIARAVAGVGAPLDGGFVEIGGGKHAVLAFDWVDGEALTNAQVSPEALDVVARDLGAALARLHLLGWRHGDVKPENVVLANDHAALVDFGLAAPFEEPLLGATPAALPPEITADGEAAFRVGAEADVYALGVVLEELARRGGTDLGERPLARLSLAPRPGDRPSAALLAGWDGTVPVDAAYLLARLPEVERAARSGHAPPEGGARAWLEGVMRAIAALAGVKANGPAMPPLDDAGRARLLVRVVGASAAAFRVPAATTDDALLAALARGDRAIALRDLLARDVQRLSPERALIRLSTRPGDEEALAALAATATSGAELDDDVAHAAITALRRAGRLGEARSLAEARLPSSEPSRVIDAAELARQTGDAGAARTLLAAHLAREEADRSRPSFAALLARLAVDRGDLDEAQRALDACATPDGAVAEVRALVAWRRGALDEGLAALDALGDDDPERQARVLLVRGMLQHARGDAVAALRACARAADLALALAAVPLEASARASAAAAAHDAGRVGDALDEGTRAVALLARLGRRADVARARLNVAATLLAIGANTEALHEAARAQADAQGSGDARAAAYALFTQAEAAHALGDPRAPALAERGRRALGASPTTSDRLLAIAYEALTGDERTMVASRDEGDRLAGTVDTPLSRWTWWRATLERGVTSALDAVLRAAELEAPPSLVGPTLAAAIEAARRSGRGDAARVLTDRLARVIARVEEHVPLGRRAAFAETPWVRAARDGRASEDPGLGAGQIELLSAIARGLRDRTSLADLLRQVLDGLVLWVGVERGVLLLRAPDGGLVPRVARGLSRDDLRGDQLTLSRTLARRALETLEPVVAVDASGDARDPVSASIHALRLRSVLAVPLVARGEALGVVYLDDRIRRGAFGPREIAWVRLLATQAGAALADARDALRLRRLARRAERAQRRLEEHLVQTEGALEVARAELATRGKPDRNADPRGTRHRYDAIVGDGEAIRRTLGLVDRVTDAADARIPVLVVGESGTGKELVARAIHDNGPRARHAFVAENCGAIPEPLLESTLFGHVRGAFTGADRARVGLFEIANGGTLLLDEIGEMSLAMQAKLLRVLQEREVRPVGGEKSTKVDVRVIGATHRDLEAMVREGRFREDLYYRLAVVSIRLPPLRERSEDLPALVSHLVRRWAGRPVRVSKQALAVLAAAPWPGNVRQLENEIRRALVLCDDQLDVEHLSPELVTPRRGEGGLSLRDQVDALERRLVTDAMRRASGNQTHAAKALGLSRFGLQKMVKRLGLTSGGARTGTGRTDSD